MICCAASSLTASNKAHHMAIVKEISNEKLWFQLHLLKMARLKISHLMKLLIFDVHGM